MWHCPKSLVPKAGPLVAVILWGIVLLDTECGCVPLAGSGERGRNGGAVRTIIIDVAVVKIERGAVTVVTVEWRAGS